MLGYEAEEFVGLPLERVIDPKHLARWSGFVADGSGPPRPDDVCLRAQGGAPGPWVELRAGRTEFRGQPAVLGIVRDISERRRAEQMLRDSEQRWKLALEGAGDGVWDWNVVTGEVWYTRRCAELVGYDEGELEPTYDEWVSLVHPEDLPQTMAILQEHLEGRTPQYVSQYRMLCKDGSWKWTRARGLVVARDAAGQPLRMVGTSSDLTQVKHAEAARAAYEQRLRESQKLEAIGTLAGGVAHDFNNVLAAILGNVALARNKVAGGNSPLFELEQLERAALRARELVQQILAFSRRQPQRLVNQALAPVVLESMRLLRATLPAIIALDVELPAEPLHAMADATQVQQVLMNLCTNAWHALAGGGGRIGVALSAFDAGEDAPAGLPAGRYVRLSVVDNGRGMDAEARDRIFEPFFTTKPVGLGTGLGLAVVHGIVSAHGGVIAVDSEPGQGSRFDVYLARVEPDAAAAIDAVAAPAPHGQGASALYIDDDDIMLVMVSQLLESAGYRVQAHHDGRAALAAFASAPEAVDVVVSDYNMPGMSGLDVAREVRRLRPDLPVVISSGYLSDDLRESADEAGVSALMHKERTVEELGPLLRRLLANEER
jgi:PAS domain S-box-containing protein